MTEAGWLACTDPEPMLGFLSRKEARRNWLPFGRGLLALMKIAGRESAFHERPTISRRRLRLFAAGCCRCIWDLLVDERSKKVVAEAERFADGLVSWEEFSRTWLAGVPTWIPRGTYSAFSAAADAATATGDEDAASAAARAADRAAAAIAWSADLDSAAAWNSAKKGQADVLRDIVGNPFRLPPAIEPAWLVWNDGTIRKIVQAIYEERAFDRLPILADALEDTGCDNVELLAHCRGDGPHVRGCWVVDLLLGKQ